MIGIISWYHHTKIYVFDEPVWMTRFKAQFRGPKSGFRMGFYAWGFFV